MAMSATALSVRMPSRLAVRNSRILAVRVAASSDTPPNVAEARAWIAAWRSKQGRMAPPAEAAAPARPPTPTNGKGKSKRAAKAAVAEAPISAAAPAPAAAAAATAPKAAPAKPQSRFGPSKSFDDGTLVFTADQLTSIKYTDVKLKKK